MYLKLDKLDRIWHSIFNWTQAWLLELNDWSKRWKNKTPTIFKSLSIATRGFTDLLDYFLYYFTLLINNEPWVYEILLIDYS